MRRRRNPCKQIRRRRMLRAWHRNVIFKFFIPFVIFLIVAVVSLSLLINYAVDSRNRKQENVQLSREFSEVFVQEEPVITVVPETEPPLAPEQSQQPEIPMKFRSLSGNVPQQAQKLYRQNNDLVGWLYINGVVSLPVVYRDNEYYLTHAFNGKHNKGGTLFLNEKHPLTEEAQHLVIHGHNMYDSSMFGILRSYEKLPILKSHAFARFSTMYAPEDYVVFAVLRVKPEFNSVRYLNYIGRPSFENAFAFNSYISELRRRSMFDIPVDVQPTDALLTLATCIDNERLIVVFRRVRDNETTEQLQAQVDMTVSQ